MLTDKIGHLLRHSMLLNLTFTIDRSIHGEGIDDIAPFVIEGGFDGGTSADGAAVRAVRVLLAPSKNRDVSSAASDSPQFSPHSHANAMS